jgi:hydroxyacylglutathione hydrolase
MLTVIPLSAFKDNYIWLLINPTNAYCAIIDPGDAEPVFNFLKNEHLNPCAILITHHHHDHSGGILALKAAYPHLVCYGPLHESIPGINHPVNEQSRVLLPELNIELQVYDIPGHTKGHVAYHGHNMLFCGDTLFAAGCGRLFEGTANQMYHSLTKLASLPENTLVYCAHEYTAANLRFAAMVEPENTAIQDRINEVAKLIAHNIPTLPSVLSLEKKTNPFLRCQKSAVINSVEKYQGEILSTPIHVFQALREWKDTF